MDRTPQMKKNKHGKQPPADFRNHPFKALKGLSPKPAPAEQKTSPVPAPRKKISSQDDASLFLRAMDGVRPMERAPKGPAAVNQLPPQPAGRVPSEERRIFLRAMLKIGATFRDETTDAETEAAPRRSQSSRIRQVKRGTLRIDEELDLHGFQRDEALLRLERFIAGARQRGAKAVLVITGKGINSAEGPVLQGAVDDWLRGKGRGMIAEYAPAPRDLGGSGAFTVFLKKA